MLQNIVGDGSRWARSSSDIYLPGDRQDALGHPVRLARLRLQIS